MYNDSLFSFMPTEMSGWRMMGTKNNIRSRNETPLVNRKQSISLPFTVPHVAHVTVLLYIVSLYLLFNKMM